MAVKTKRLGGFQPFLRTTECEDGRYAGNQVGCVTYDEDENYQVSYFEMGFRCDHVVDHFVKTTVRNNADNPQEYDADLMRPNPVTEAVKADREKRDVAST